ncbi:hypothetical protein X767_15945 [Mesorhizobium sp. LSJC264A00]|nr:hypothetical protein X767_15945 [Mesorhizobium sp. LSJC264A00]
MLAFSIQISYSDSAGTARDSSIRKSPQAVLANFNPFTAINLRSSRFVAVDFGVMR